MIHTLNYATGICSCKEKIAPGGYMAHLYEHIQLQTEKIEAWTTLATMLEQVSAIEKLGATLDLPDETILEP